ncbi:MAG: beta-glucosidase [Chitinivibrionales bacterium]|nr:beta-glucosidase [Chitinivibrionales bacterium]
MRFPQHFTWGVASSSYQIEGGARDDGKGLSIWDIMCREPGRTWQGDTGDIAADHYHRYEEDVDLIAGIGARAYRFSLSWPRILPHGTGTVNPAGIAFYDRLVDRLLSKGIEPWITLFHWDYPYELYCRGGWLNPDSAPWFAEYARVVVDALSDRVTHWMTQNEPQCFIGLGHQTGEHAPGLRLGLSQVLRAAHHALLGHGLAVQAIRAHAHEPPVVGAAPVGVVKAPASESTNDIEAARRAMFAITEKTCWNNTWFADPMVRGEYPEDGLALFGTDAPHIGAGDMETICQPLDFYGANIYNAQAVRATDNGPEPLTPPTGPPLTTMRWKMTPEALYWGPRFLYERYRLPIVVTENGMANCDWVQRDGKVHDPQRIDFVGRYLTAYRRAIADGVDGRGYFHWSLLDDLEWNEGYQHRLGLVHVDFDTGKRTPKDSATWYRSVIESNGEALGTAEVHR